MKVSSSSVIDQPSPLLTSDLKDSLWPWLPLKQSALCSLSKETLAQMIERSEKTQTTFGILIPKHSSDEFTSLEAWWDDLQEKILNPAYCQPLTEMAARHTLYTYFPQFNKWVVSGLPLHIWSKLGSFAQNSLQEMSKNYDHLRELVTLVFESGTAEERFYWFKSYLLNYFSSNPILLHQLNSVTLIEEFHPLLFKFVPDKKVVALLIWSAYTGIGTTKNTRLSLSLIQSHPNDEFLHDLVLLKMTVDSDLNFKLPQETLRRLQKSPLPIIKSFLSFNLLQSGGNLTTEMIEHLTKTAYGRNSTLDFSILILYYTAKLSTEPKTNLITIFKLLQGAALAGTSLLNLFDIPHKIYYDTKIISSFFGDKNLDLDCFAILKPYITSLNYTMAMGNSSALLYKADLLLTLHHVFPHQITSTANNILALLPEKEKTSGAYLNLMGCYHLNVSKKPQFAVNCFRQAINKGSAHAAWSLYRSIKELAINKDNTRGFSSLEEVQLLHLFKANKALGLPTALELSDFYRSNSSHGDPILYEIFHFKSTTPDLPIYEPLYHDKFFPLHDHTQIVNKTLTRYNVINGYSIPTSGNKLYLHENTFCSLSHKLISQLIREAHEKNHPAIVIASHIENFTETWVYSGFEYLLHRYDRYNSRKTMPKITHEEYYICYPGESAFELLLEYTDGESSPIDLKNIQQVIAFEHLLQAYANEESLLEHSTVSQALADQISGEPLASYFIFLKYRMLTALSTLLKINPPFYSRDDQKRESIDSWIEKLDSPLTKDLVLQSSAILFSPIAQTVGELAEQIDLAHQIKNHFRELLPPYIQLLCNRMIARSHSIDQSISINSQDYLESSLTSLLSEAKSGSLIALNDLFSTLNSLPTGDEYREWTQKNHSDLQSLAQKLLQQARKGELKSLATLSTLHSRPSTYAQTYIKLDEDEANLFIQEGVARGNWQCYILYSNTLTATLNKKDQIPYHLIKKFRLETIFHSLLGQEQACHEMGAFTSRSALDRLQEPHRKLALETSARWHLLASRKNSLHSVHSASSILESYEQKKLYEKFWTENLELIYALLNADHPIAQAVAIYILYDLKECNFTFSTELILLTTTYQTLYQLHQMTPAESPQKPRLERLLSHLKASLPGKPS